jgi:hypothetical protein
VHHSSIRFGLAIAAVALGMLPRPALASGISPPYLAAGVWTINLAGGDWGGKDLASRMPCHANSLLSAASSTGVDWDFIATQEAHDADDVPCYVRGGELMSATGCLAEAIRGSRNVAYHSTMDVGIIVNADRYDVLSWHERGLVRWKSDGKIKGVTAVRVRHKATGVTFIVSSVHIRTNAAYFCERHGEVDGLVDALEDWSDPADASPIVAGDFNCFEDSIWGADPGMDQCPGFPGWDLFLSRLENDRKLCRYLAKAFANDSQVYDKDMVLTRRGKPGFAPLVGGGSAPSSYNGEGCSDHGYAYAAYAVDSLVWMVPLLLAD